MKNQSDKLLLIPKKYSFTNMHEWTRWASKAYNTLNRTRVFNVKLRVKAVRDWNPHHPCSTNKKRFWVKGANSCSCPEIYIDVYPSRSLRMDLTHNRITPWTRRLPPQYRKEGEKPTWSCSITQYMKMANSLLGVTFRKEIVV